MMAVDISGVKTLVVYWWCIMTGENPSYIDTVKNHWMWVFGGNNVFLMWFILLIGTWLLRFINLSINIKYIQLVECSNSVG